MCQVYRSREGGSPCVHRLSSCRSGRRSGARPDDDHRQPWRQLQPRLQGTRATTRLRGPNAELCDPPSLTHARPAVRLSDTRGRDMPSPASTPANGSRSRMARRLGLAFAVAVSAGCGGPDCPKLGRDLAAAFGAFTPVSSNACSSAADCTGMESRGCWAGCGVVVSNARAAELGTFLDNDPRVAAACKAYTDARCDRGILGPSCPAVVPECTTGQCARGNP